jgi:hypothetical protein
MKSLMWLVVATIISIQCADAEAPPRHDMWWGLVVILDLRTKSGCAPMPHITGPDQLLSVLKRFFSDREDQPRVFHLPGSPLYMIPIDTASFKLRFMAFTDERSCLSINNGNDLKPFSLDTSLMERFKK